MKLEHTPGPWKIGTPPPNGEQTIGTDKGLMVATATTGYINTKANARLIAAAPEMLHALIDALDTIKYVREYVAGQGLSAEEDCDESIKIIQHAIERATGNTIDEVIK